MRSHSLVFREDSFVAQILLDQTPVKGVRRLDPLSLNPEPHDPTPSHDLQL